eukprot:TRINITY_DN9937_c0_g1_i2.p1 TRINITY_DN9937_c0_g1~~TRINITY_DN9937_c0_g1_i2.p1  ORF type:complete len:354 (-),score=109.72 TRINITY_DN9937_c0_g1_i2:496-1557(-)
MCIRDRLHTMQKDRQQYENEMKKLAEQRSSLESNEEVRGLEQVLASLNEKIKSSKKSKEDASLYRFQVEKAYELATKKRSEICKKIGSAQAKNPALIQSEIASLEQKGVSERQLEDLKESRQSLVKSQGEYSSYMQILQMIKYLQQRWQLIADMKTKANLPETNDYPQLIALKEQEQVKMNMVKQEVQEKLIKLKTKQAEAEATRREFIEKLKGKAEIQSNIVALTSKYHQGLGEIRNLRAVKEQNEEELKAEQYRNIRGEIQFLEFQMISAERIALAIDKRHDAIEEGIMIYHNKKMEEINKAIHDLWKLTYKSKDIEMIEIRSDVEKTNARSRSFNYRIVFKTPEYPWSNF